MVTVSPCAHQQTHHCTQRDHRFWMKFFLNALVSASAHRIQIWELQFRQKHSCGANATLYDWEWQDMCKWLWTAADYMQWKPRAQRLHQCETLQITYDNAEQMKRANSTSRNMSITRLLQKYNNIIWEDNGPLSMANWGMPSATCVHSISRCAACFCRHLCDITFCRMQFCVCVLSLCNSSCMWFTLPSGLASVPPQGYFLHSRYLRLFLRLLFRVFFFFLLYSICSFSGGTYANPAVVTIRPILHLQN